MNVFSIKLMRYMEYVDRVDNDNGMDGVKLRSEQIYLKRKYKKVFRKP